MRFVQLVLPLLCAGCAVRPQELSGLWGEKKQDNIRVGGYRHYFEDGVRHSVPSPVLSSAIWLDQTGHYDLYFNDGPVEVGGNMWRAEPSGVDPETRWKRYRLYLREHGKGSVTSTYLAAMSPDGRRLRIQRERDPGILTAECLLYRITEYVNGVEVPFGFSGTPVPYGGAVRTISEWGPF